MKLQNLFESQYEGIYSFHIGTLGASTSDKDADYNSNLPTGITYKREGYAASYVCKNFDDLYNFVSANKKVNWLLSGLSGAGSQINYLLFWIDAPDLKNVPSIIDSNFMCRGNRRITSLKDVHKQIKQINAKGHGNGVFDVSSCDIESHVLGVLLINGVNEVYFDNKKVKDIINKHLAGDRDILNCQSELIDAGLKEYAQL